MALRSTLVALLTLWMAFAIRNFAGAPSASDDSPVSCADASEVLCNWLLGQPIDINRASVEELRLLPNIGPALARRIVEHRQQHGAFFSMQELTAVRGIGPRTISKLEGLASVSSKTQPASKRNSKRKVTVR